MLKSVLCIYCDGYILVKGKITITGAGVDAAARQADERNKVVELYLKIKLYLKIMLALLIVKVE